MTKEFTYKSCEIRLRVVQSKKRLGIWMVEIIINGQLITLSALHPKFPPKAFSSKDEAMDYGQLAAKYLLDHPPASCVTLEDLF